MPIYEALISGRYFNQLVQNKFHFETDGTIALQAMCNTLRDSFVAVVRLAQNSELVYTDLSVKKVSSGVQEFFSIPLAVTGAHSPEVSSMSTVAVVIQKRTNLPGRRFRGRFHFVGYRTGLVIRGELTPQGLEEWQFVADNLAENFIAPANTGMRLVLHSPPEPLDIHVETLTARKILGVMRSRNIGVGG